MMNNHVEYQDEEDLKTMHRYILLSTTFGEVVDACSGIKVVDQYSRWHVPSFTVKKETAKKPS